MGFESLAALAALTGVVLPVLLHVRSRAAERFAQFPNIDLMRDLERASRYERIVAGAPLLVMRAGIIAFAAVAASSPFIGELPPNSAALSSGDVVVLLDRSPVWRDPSDFDRAKRVAGRILESTEGRGRGWLLAFDSFPGRPVPAETGIDVLRNLSPGGGTADLKTAIDTAASHIGCGAPPQIPGRVELEPITMIVLSTHAQVHSIDSQAVPDGIRMMSLACSSLGRLPNPRIAEAQLEEGLLRVRCVDCPGMYGPVLKIHLDDEPDAHVVRRLSNRSGSSEFEDTVIVPALPRTARLLGLDIEVPGRSSTSRRYWLELPHSESPQLHVVASQGDPWAAGVVAMSVAAIAAASQESDALVDLGTRFTAPHALSRESLVDADALLIPDITGLNAKEWTVADEFVRRGGVLLAIAAAPVPAPASRLLGIKSPGEVLSGRVTLLGDRSPLRGVEPIVLTSRLGVSPSDASVLSTYDDGWPALLSNAVGRGRTYLLTSDLNELLDRPNIGIPLVNSLLRAILSERAVARATSVRDAPLVFEVSAARSSNLATVLSPGGNRHVLDIVAIGGEPVRRWLSAAVCDQPGLWRILLDLDTEGTSAEHFALIGVNAVETDSPADTEPGDGANRVTIYESSDELLSAMEGKGTTSVGPYAGLAALLLLTCEPVIRRMTMRRAPL